MQRYNREPFNPEAQFACVKPFVMSGVAYQLGEIVDTGTIEARRLRQMYEARMIEVAKDKTPALLKPAVKPVAKTAPPPAAERRAEHRGFGRWYVMEPDGSESGPFSKEVAEARAAG